MSEANLVYKHKTIEAYWQKKWKKKGFYSVKNKGKDFTIIPEYRISEKLTTELKGTNLDAMISSSLSLTGASLTVFDSTNDSFLPRYSTTDLIEYLDPFMEQGTEDLEFNKLPRHFQMKSDAVLKLLPYDGFYPAERTVQIAEKFDEVKVFESGINN